MNRRRMVGWIQGILNKRSWHVLLLAWACTEGNSVSAVTEPAPPDAAIRVRADGAVALRSRASGISETAAKGAQVLYNFGLPAQSPERQWLDKDLVPICHSHWAKNGIDYSQVVFLTRLNPGDLMPGGKIPADAVLVVQLTGENKSSEYTGAKAALAVTWDESPLELDLREDLVSATKLANRLIALVEIPSGAVARVNGGQLQFEGHMPPGTSGSMTIKLPIYSAPSEAEITRLRDLDCDDELRRVRKFWAEDPRAREIKAPSVEFEERPASENPRSRPVPAVDDNWPVYLGDKASSQFSNLDQINTTNVDRLEVAWTYRSGDARADNRSQIQCNPLIIDGVLYGTSPQLKLLALNAATGRELWRFDPFAASAENSALGVNRGVVYWADDSDRRILFTAGHYLYAIEATSGSPVAGFGQQGRVDIREGLGRDPKQLFVLANTPGIVYQDRLILGTRVSEGPGPSAPGHIRAYNIRTGQLAWSFRTIPHPGEPGYETWPPDAWRFSGGANCWAGMALDEKRGLVFCPTGSAAFDFWGGNRIGQNLFANCLLALDAASGRRIWHFQFVHHDLWDRDLPAPPNLLTVRRDGKEIDAVAQITKSGHVFVFNRETGEPLFPIEERPVPASDLQGESTWPTQPLPVKPAPFARQLFTADEITDLSPESYKEVLARFVKVRPHVPFMPPTVEGTIIFPGFDGGGEWGGAAVDPKEGVLYVNGNEMPWILTMVPTKQGEQRAVSSGQQIYSQICAACHGLTGEGDPARAYPTLVHIEQKLKKPEIITLVSQGRGNMPAFAFLSDSQKEAVVDFILGVKPSAVADRSPHLPEPELALIEPYTHTGYNRWLDTNGFPAVKPPWGTLNAIDLNTGEYRWQTTLGEFPELSARGIPPTGAENYGGPIITAGGLVFIAASKDEMIRAFDQKTGKVLWQAKLPAGGYATPSSYSVNNRQYVVIACGGGKMGTKSGDAYVAFALPER